MLVTDYRWTDYRSRIGWNAHQRRILHPSCCLKLLFFSPPPLKIQQQKIKLVWEGVCNWCGRTREKQTARFFRGKVNKSFELHAIFLHPNVLFPFFPPPMFWRTKKKMMSKMSHKATEMESLNILLNFSMNNACLFLLKVRRTPEVHPQPEIHTDCLSRACSASDCEWKLFFGQNVNVYSRYPQFIVEPAWIRDGRIHPSILSK